MKQLFHLKSRNLNEKNLTSSKAKTLNEPISVREISQCRNFHMTPQSKIWHPSQKHDTPVKHGTLVISFEEAAEAFELHPSSSRRAELSITWCQTICVLAQIQKTHLIKWKLKHELFHLNVNYFIQFNF